MNGNPSNGSVAASLLESIVFGAVNDGASGSGLGNGSVPFTGHTFPVFAEGSGEALSIFPATSAETIDSPSASMLTNRLGEDGSAVPLADDAGGGNNDGGPCIENYDYYEPTEKWLLGIVALPFIIMGLLANAMSVRIFSHRYMRQQSVNWYLLILAISDSVILFGAFFVLTLPRLGEILSAWDATYVSYYTTPYMYSLMTLAQTVSVWMTAAMSLHRFIGVCLPYQAGTILNTHNIRILIVGILVTSVLFNITRFFEVRIVQVCHMVPINAELPVLGPTELRMNRLYRRIFYEWAYTLIMFAIPFTILIIVNGAVIMAIHKSRKIHAQLNMYDDGVRKQELAKEISTSIMLVAIVVAFLICNILAFVVNIMEKLELYELYVMFVPWSNMLVMTNASVNICIYCMFSDKYRKLMVHYLNFFCQRRCGMGSGAGKSSSDNNFHAFNLSSF